MTSVSYQFSKSELTRVSFTRKFLRPRILIYITVVSLVGIMAILKYQMPTGFVLLSLALFLPALLYFRIRQSISNLPWLISDTTLSFDDEGLRISTAACSQETKWSALRNWKQNDDYFFLFIDGNSAFTIPKRAFTPESQVEFQKCLLNIRA